MKELIRFRKEIYLSLFQELRGKKRFVFLFYALLLILNAAVKLTTPQVYSAFVDKVLIAGETSLFSSIALNYFFLYLLSALSALGQCGIQNWLCNTLEYGLRLPAVELVIYPCGEKRTESRMGEIKRRIDNDISSLIAFFREQFGDFELQGLLTAGSALFLLFLNPPLALCGILAVPLTLWMDQKISRKENVLNKQNRENDDRMSDWLHCVVRGWRQIRILGREKTQERRYVRFQHNYALYNAKWINYWVTRVLIIPKLKDEFLMKLGVYFLGGIFLLLGWMSAGELLVFLVYYRQMTASMTAFSEYQASLRSGMPVYTRAVSWRTEWTEKRFSGKKALLHSIREITLEKVSFQYTSESPTLFRNINGQYRAGDCVGIRGASGCGKSTLLKLMLKLENPTRGKIWVNGRKLASIDPASYYRRISVYIQGTSLFHATIRENLLFAAPDASEEDLILACRKAQIWDEIVAMPERLDTDAGERGCRLSGGQCQRILLARAFLREADVYYFDEPASALDAVKAEAVYREIRKLSEKKIVFLVSHDWKADEACDKFIYI